MAGQAIVEARAFTHSPDELATSDTNLFPKIAPCSLPFNRQHKLRRVINTRPSPPLTDPPENVLINAPSDKLNLVEGSNGPHLSCEASGEPQVQYRWLLLRRGNNIVTSGDLVASRYKMKHYGNLGSGSANSSSGSHSSSGTGSGPGPGQTGFQVAPGGRASRSFSSPKMPSNDVVVVDEDDQDHDSDSSPALTADDDNSRHLVKLTSLSFGDQVGAVGVSTLDLSGGSIDRKHAGHYICEASNKLGRTRHSIYVNVLCKYCGHLSRYRLL